MIFLRPKPFQDGVEAGRGFPRTSGSFRPANPFQSRTTPHSLLAAARLNWSRAGKAQTIPKRSRKANHSR